MIKVEIKNWTNSEDPKRNEEYTLSILFIGSGLGRKMKKIKFRAFNMKRVNRVHEFDINYDPISIELSLKMKKNKKNKNITLPKIKVEQAFKGMVIKAGPVTFDFLVHKFKTEKEKEIERAKKIKERKQITENSFQQYLESERMKVLSLPKNSVRSTVFSAQGIQRTINSQQEIIEKNNQKVAFWIENMGDLIEVISTNTTSSIFREDLVILTKLVVTTTLFFRKIKDSPPTYNPGFEPNVPSHSIEPRIEQLKNEKVY